MELIPGAIPVDYVKYRARKKAREVEEFEINCQLKAEFIEHSNSEWAGAVFLAP